MGPKCLIVFPYKGPKCSPKCSQKRIRLARSLAVFKLGVPLLDHVWMNSFGSGYGWNAEKIHSPLLSLNPTAIVVAKVTWFSRGITLSLPYIQEHTMDFDNEISSDDPEATAAANSIAAAVGGGSSRRSSKKSRGSRRSDILTFQTQVPFLVLSQVLDFH